MGRAAAACVDRWRVKVSCLIGCNPSEVVFTSGATEANNLAIFGILGGRNAANVVTTSAEHQSILRPLVMLRSQQREIVTLCVDQFGQIPVGSVESSLRKTTSLVSVIFANNEVGAINPIAEIGAMCRERGVLFHVDATQAVGKIPIDLSTLPVDLMSFSAHKLYGPKGIGALYVNRATVRDQIRPIMYGGDQEDGLRPGTVSLPLVVGFGRACELCQELMSDDPKRIGTMRDRLWERFQMDIPDVVLNGHSTNRLYNNLNVSFLGIPSEAFMVKLRDVIAVSAGSACTSANPEPSHVLRAMGIHGDRLESAIRFGLGRFNTMEEIEYVADHVRNAVLELRRHV